MKLLSVFIFIAALYEVKAGTKRNCGPVLVEVLQTICTNGYNKLLTKKSVPVYNELDVMDAYNNIEDDMPLHAENSFLDDLLVGDHAVTFAKTRRRRSLLGIYEECCLKGCSFDELKSYCN